jgi:GNAT superfamily N-acetyltransferase
MSLLTEPVTPANLDLFVRYCREHGAEHDSSYLPESGFHLTPEQPSYLLWSGSTLIGAASLLLIPRYTGQGVGRFAILHSTLAAAEAYARLLAAIQPHAAGVRKLSLFLPDTRTQTAGFLQGLGFTVERYSHVLRRAPAETIDVTWPEGVALETVGPDDPIGAGQVADCINESFARLAGHAPLTGDDIRASFGEEGYLEGGILLLKQDGRPIGTMTVMREWEDPGTAEVVTLGVVPARQGGGLGRRLLRHGVDLAARRDFHSVALAVNAENESALRLYLSEGFQPIKTMVCYAMQLDRGAVLGSAGAQTQPD